MDGETHTVIWTDASTDVPVGLTSVAQVIEDMTSE
jgi:hypothetical protein